MSLVDDFIAIAEKAEKPSTKALDELIRVRHKLNNLEAVRRDLEPEATEEAFALMGEKTGTVYRTSDAEVQLRLKSIVPTIKTDGELSNLDEEIQLEQERIAREKADELAELQKERDFQARCLQEVDDRINETMSSPLLEELKGLFARRVAEATYQQLQLAIKLK